MKIVILDGETMNPGDLSWERMASLGELTAYKRSTYEEACRRIEDAQAVFFNMVDMDSRMISCGPKIEFLGITATGCDNMDVAAAAARGIACTNAPAYSTEAVAQHTIALMLELTNNVGLHQQSVRSGEWNAETGYCYWKTPLTLLAGKSLGIAGYGRIGSRVAAIAEALGMKINIYSRDPAAAMSSDFLTLHLPAADNTIDFINRKSISEMKDGAVLINAARGQLVNENDLAEALKSGRISAYAADALIDEPPRPDNPLIGLDNCIITPHHAWCPRETRQKLLDICTDNLESYLSGGTLNRVDLQAQIPGKHH